MTEEPLGGGWTTEGVVRVGDTVRRPPVFATQLMRDVLVYLERVGFDAAPRWRGFDEQGCDTLTLIEGDTFSDTRAIVWEDNQLENKHAVRACSWIPMASMWTRPHRSSSRTRRPHGRFTRHGWADTIAELAHERAGLARGQPQSVRVRLDVNCRRAPQSTSNL